MRGRWEEACAPESIHRRLLPGVCGCCVSRDASVNLAQKGSAPCLP